MKRCFKLVLVLLVASLPAASILAQDRSSGGIKGKVRVETGKPSGVSVIVRQGEIEVARGVTDKNGEFVVSRLAPGRYGVTLRKPGLSIGTIEDIEVKAGKTRSLGDRLVLSIDDGSIAFIRGSVFTEGGRSVPGVRVELARVVSENSTEKLDSRITGETGEFVFRAPPDSARYRVTVKADGAEPASKDVEVDGASVYRVALTLKPNPK